MRVLTLRRLLLVLASLFILLMVAVLFGLGVGSSGLTPGEVIRALGGADPSAAATDIVLGIRLPRVLLAALVGSSLAVAGVLFQALLRNPLADPFVLGVSGGAALGGITALSLGGALGFGYAAVPPAAFLAAAATTFLLYLVAGGRGRFSATTLLLTGVIFNSFASAAIVFIASLSGFTQGASIFLWLIGNLSGARMELAGWVAGFLVAGLGCALVFARSLNLMALGEESAEQLGVDVVMTQRALLVAASLMVGAAVAVSGLIGFVGLIIPHLLRLVSGSDHRLLVPSAALGGAAFLVVCDTLARTVISGHELPVGAITALAGGPFFLILLRRYHARVYAP